MDMKSAYVKHRRAGSCEIGIETLCIIHLDEKGMPHNVFGLSFWMVSVIFVVIWMILDLIDKSRNVVGRVVAIVQNISIAVSIALLAMQFVQWSQGH